MKTSGLTAIVIALLFVASEGQVQSSVASQQPLAVHCNCNCGSTCKVMFDLMKSALCPKRPTTDPCQKAKKNCLEVLKCGGTQSGEYSIDPDGKGAFKVYCDQTTAGGGWTVFQRRQDGSVDFYRGWNDYKKGFGDLKGEFWLGLDNIHRLTNQTPNRLRVEQEDTTGNSAYAKYDYFAVSNEQSNYKLSLGSYSGTAGDSLSYHGGMAFSTKDHDNDKWSKNCAVTYKGAWWYNACHKSNLNGLYLHGKHKSFANGVNWKAWKGYHYSAKRAEMKIKPVGS